MVVLFFQYSLCPSEAKDTAQECSSLAGGSVYRGADFVALPAQLPGSLPSRGIGVGQEFPKPSFPPVSTFPTWAVRVHLLGMSLHHIEDTLLVAIGEMSLL